MKKTKGPVAENTGEYFLVLGGVPVEEISNCITWAFGPYMKFLLDRPVEELRLEWNKRHSDIFEIMPYDSIVMALVCIGKAFSETELTHGRAKKPKTILDFKDG